MRTGLHYNNKSPANTDSEFYLIAEIIPHLKMGLNGYIVHNNFVYRSTSPHTLMYTIFLIVFAYVFYQKIWPTMRRLTACGLRVAVNILFIQHLSRCVCAYSLQVYRCVTGGDRRVTRPRPTARFKERNRRVSGSHRSRVISQVRYWVPPAPSPLISTTTLDQLQHDQLP